MTYGVHAHWSANGARLLDRLSHPPKRFLVSFECQFLGVLLLDLDGQMTLGSVVGCVGNQINTMGFPRCHFFTYLVSWMISNSLLDVLVVSGLLLWIFDCLGSCSENS